MKDGSVRGCFSILVDSTDNCFFTTLVFSVARSAGPAEVLGVPVSAKSATRLSFEKVFWPEETNAF